MDHDHGHGGHGDMGPMCSMNMLFTWDTTNLCIVFRSWRIDGPLSLAITLVAIVAITAGYEALREFTRWYDAQVARRQDIAPHDRRHNDGEDDDDAEAYHTENTPLVAAGTGSSSHGPGQRARVIKAILYAINNFYAFMIMLLFMTYNGFVMIAVAVGAGVGYYIWGDKNAITKGTACH
ncbi:Ctr copper transporter family protein [Xylariaceae sp. FL0804]|nr:Ctr copper transporter family protein [Xylariaceae sp. FL0804]